MKHNLETIKEKLDAHFQSQNVQSFEALQEEINGFEKELREKLDIHSVGEDAFTNGYIFALKRILGETK